MGLMHKLEIAWDDLMDAFSSGQTDRAYFLDRMTGEIFFVHSALQDDDFWQQIDSHQERFLEIPRFDYGLERQVTASFLSGIANPELRHLLQNAPGRRLYGKLDDILEFYPEEQSRLLEMRENFVTSRMKNWLEENNLFASDAATLLQQIG